MNTLKNKSRKLVAWMLVILLLASSMVPAFAHYPAEPGASFSWNIFNNGPGGTQYPRPNAGLAATGIIRMWSQLDGVNTPVYLAAADTIVALDQNGQCAMEFVRISRVWVAGEGWQDYFNLLDINKNGNWQQIDLYITVFGQTVDVLLVNANYSPAAEYHTVTFVIEAGAVGVYAATTITVEVPDGETIPADAIPSTDARPGFYFVEWYPSDPAYAIVTEDMTFTARFNPLFHYVTFEAGDGGRLVAAEGFGLVVRIRDGFAFWPDRVPTPVADEGYVFVKWYPYGPADFVVREDMTFTAVFAEAVPKIVSVEPSPVVVEQGGTAKITVTTQNMPDGAWVDLNVAWRPGLSVVGGPRFYVENNQAIIIVSAAADARLGRDGFSVTARAAGDWGIPFIIDSYTFVIEVVENDTPPPPPPDVFDFIFLLFDDFAEDRGLGSTVNINPPGAPFLSETDPATVTGLYYDSFNRFGRVSRVLNVDGRPAWQSLAGWAAGDAIYGVGHRGMYETRIVAGVGLTPDNSVFRPTGNPVRAEGELYIEFGVRSFWGANVINGTYSIGDARAFSLFGYNGTSAADRVAFAGFNLRYSEANNGVLEAHIVENGVETRTLLGTTGVFAPDNSNVWFDINVYVSMASSATANDGILRIYVDGVLEIEATDLNWFDPVFGFNDVGLYTATNCMTRPPLGQITRWYGPLKVARIPNATLTDPFDVSLQRFLTASGRRQQQLAADRFHYDIIMEPGTPVFTVTLWPIAPDAEVWVSGVQVARDTRTGGFPVSLPLDAIPQRPAFADESTGNVSWGIVDHAGVLEVEVRPAAGAAFSQIYTFSVEMLTPYTVVDIPRPEWLWWDDFSDWGNTQIHYAGRGSTGYHDWAFFNPTPGTGLGGTWSLEARFDRSIVGSYGAFSSSDVAIQFYDPWGTNITMRPDGLPLPPGRTIDYEAAGFPPGTNAYIDNRRLNPGPGNWGGDIDDMFLRFYLRMDRHWGDFLLWDDPSFWGPSRPGGAAGNNGQNFILEGAGGGHDKLMRFMGRTQGTNYQVTGPFSGQAPLGPQPMANGVIANPSDGRMAQTFILHSWTMAPHHPHHFLGLDPTSGVDITTTVHGGRRLWQPLWPGLPAAERPGMAGWDRLNTFNSSYAAWNWKRTEIRAQFDAINAINALPLDQRPPGAMPGFAQPGSGHAVITERQNDFNYLNWLGASLGGGEWPNIPIFDNDHVGEWYLVEQRVRLNTPGQNNGIMQLWINEKLVVHRDNINFRGWNIEAGITRIQLEVYANSPRGATVDASRYISHLVASTAYIGPATFVPTSPLEHARTELRNILTAQVGVNFVTNPVFVLDEVLHTPASWGAYVAAINAAIAVYNTSNDIAEIQAAGQAVLVARAALVLRDVILVERPAQPEWLFWQDFDGNTGNNDSGAAMIIQGLGSVEAGTGIGSSSALQATMAPGDTARINFPSQEVVYIRFYTRAYNLTGVGGSAFWARVFNTNTWGAYQQRINVYGNGSIGLQPGGGLPGTAGVLNSTEWVGLEMRFDMNARTVTTWVDGNLRGTVPLDPGALTQPTINGFQFHNFTGYGSGYRFYDNFVISTAYIGPMLREFVDGPANKAALTAAIDAEVGTDRNNLVWARDEADYTPATWSAFVAAVEAAIAMEANATATQGQVNAALAALNAAIAALEPVGGLPPRANWLFWNNFDGDTGGAGGMTVGTGGAIVPYNSNVFRDSLVGNTLTGGGVSPLRIQFPAQEVVYIRFDVRSDVTGMGYGWWGRVHAGAYWGTTSFRMNNNGAGAITNHGVGAVPGTAGLLSTNVWQCVEIRFNIPAAQMTVWINGQYAGTGPMQTGRTITSISVFELHQYTDQGTGYRIYDNFVVSTSRIGYGGDIPWLDPVDLARAALTAAIDAQVGTDRNNLVFTLTQADWTPASWNAFVAVIEVAIVVEADANATLAQINAAIADIAAAIAALEPADPPDPRDDWLFWQNFDGDTGGAGSLTAHTASGGTVGAFGVGGSQGFRGILADNTTPLTIDFPTQSLVYIRFDVRTEVTNPGLGFWGRVQLGTAYWNGFRLNATGGGGITSQGIGNYVGIGGPALISDQWTCVEIRFNVGATPPMKTVWINGTYSGSLPMQQPRPINTINRFQLHSFNGQGTGYRFYDNFVVSTQRIGYGGNIEWVPPPPTDFTALTAAIDAEVVTRSPLVFVRDEADYTPASWAPFAAAITAAIAIEADTNATQPVVDAAVSAIAAARLGLFTVDQRANWIFWDNFDGDVGGTPIAIRSPSEIGPTYGVDGNPGLRTALASHSPLTIRFPANEVVFIRFDTRAVTTGTFGGWFGRVYLGQNWGSYSFRLNSAMDGTLASPGGGGVVPGTAGLFSSDTWRCVEIMFNIPAATKTVWINGVLAGTAGLEGGRTVTQIDGFDLNYYNPIPGGHRYFDNFVVSTSRIGYGGNIVWAD